MIYFGIAALAMVLTMGLAVEGGRVFVTYRQMQTTADLAALVGAQDLPTNPDSAAIDACTFAQKNGFGSGTCTSSPPSAGSGGNSAVAACVPPASKTPYDVNIASYGGSTSGCSTRTSSIYIEVQIAYNIGTVPIFNVPVTLYSHAVARNGIPDVPDYAIVAMNATTSISGGSLKFNNNTGIVVVGSTFVNSSDSASMQTPGSGKQLMCNGSWVNSSSEPLGSLNLYNVTSSNVEPSYAPPGCIDSSNSVVTTAAAGPAQAATAGGTYINSAGRISDPYGNTDCPDASASQETAANIVVGDESCPQSPAATSGTNMANSCALCLNTAWYLDRGRNKWLQASASQPSASGSDVLELFPGVYPGGICATGGTIYLNPGVYTLSGTCSGSASFKTTGGPTICIFGAPVCDVVNGSWNSITTSITNNSQYKTTVPYYLGSQTNWSKGNCGSAVFNDSTSESYAPSDAWYYYCSPWGTWDPNVSNEKVTCTSAGCSGNPGYPTALTTPPVFLKQDGTASTMPLNGVTFYLKTGDMSVAGSAGQALAMPNPCYGNGSGSNTNSPPTTAGSSSAAFPGGDTGLQYKYPSTSLGPVNGLANTGLAGTMSSTTGNIYPSADVETPCKDSAGNVLNYQVWNYEFGASSFPTGQHLHFLVFAKDAASSISLSGGGPQNWWGIIHTWPFQSTGSFPGPPDTTEGYTGDSITISGNAGGSGGPAMLFGQIIGDNIQFAGSSLVQVFDRPGGRPSAPGVGLVQ